MKKLISLLTFLLLFATYSSAQSIFTRIIKYDKFDDVVSDRTVKTLITRTEKTFIVETKGEEPIVYMHLDNLLAPEHIGRRDSIVNLVDNVYGYESRYTVFTEKEAEEIVKEETDKYNKETAEYPVEYYAALSIASKGEAGELPVITIRTVSEYDFVFEFKRELFWIRYPDGTRTIYIRD